ncbi:winged helix-turn-helix transcriptional regulator [Skermania piniformis]|uniref:Winged helix-turn-helix transcriptional regulator n=1 Tax=Skermania pinensis TaxID=39122 RepID=A0ABX8SB71_9ACTN|nr:winged helix-turn-helix transcriptional regulator [Skermania piniformis]QXQ15108.1 winged helix-turn-helix transcriptional regulator [Skermania piniformis]
MATRSYGDACGIARALDLIGDRWSLLVVRELVLGPKRYTDLQAGLGRIGPDVLSQRLRDLEAAGLVRRSTVGGPGRVRVYELTARGVELEPVLHALGRFGSAVALPADSPDFSPDAAVVALRTMFDPARAVGRSVEAELRLSGEVFRVAVRDGALLTVRGAAVDPQVVLDTAPRTLAALVWHGLPVAAAPDTTVAGDPAALERLFAVFAGVGRSDPEE